MAGAPFISVFLQAAPAAASGEASEDWIGAIFRIAANEAERPLGL